MPRGFSIGGGAAIGKDQGGFPFYHAHASAIFSKDKEDIFVRNLERLSVDRLARAAV